MADLSIKFSQHYEKLPHIFTNVVLLDVLRVKLEDLSSTFIKYDTSYIENGENQYYPLPSKGDYLLLLFHQPITNQLFTSIRPNVKNKYDYYKSNIGQKFYIEIIKTKSNQTQQDNIQRIHELSHIDIQKFYKWLDLQSFTQTTKQALRETKLEIVNGKLVAHTKNELHLKIIEKYFKIHGLSLETTNIR